MTTEMTMTSLTNGRARIAGAATGALLLLAAAPARAQDAAVAPGLAALTGCWAPSGVGSVGPLLCVVPGEGGTTEIASVDSGRVLTRVRVDAAGTRRPVEKEGCTGWESAQASPSGERVYLRTEFRCAGGVERSSSGVLALNSVGDLLDVQAVKAKSGSAVRVGRYREAPAGTALPAELGAVARAGAGLAVSAARTAATAPLDDADIVEVARAVDAPAVEAWLVERQQKFDVDARRLVALADAGVPARVTDMLVALAYPKVFAVNPSTGASGVRPAQLGDADALAGTSGRRVYVDPLFGYSPFGWSPYASLYGASLYGFGGGFGGGFGRGGYYYGGAPIIVVRGSGAPGDPENVAGARRGRAVNGRGYTRDRGTDGAGSATPRSRVGSDGGSGVSGGGAGGASSRGGDASSSGSGSGRTAKPRP
jgi:hypothetical protein